MTALNLSAAAAQVVDFPLFKQFGAASQVVIVNAATSGTVVPVVDGMDVVRERKVNGKNVATIAALAPGEQAPLTIHAPHPRTLTVVLKYYDTAGAFVGATTPKQVFIPAAPQTTREAVMFSMSDLKR